MPLKDMATSTGAFVFLRYVMTFVSGRSWVHTPSSTLGGTIGITIGEAIISSGLQQRLRGVTGLIINTSTASVNDSIRQMPLIPVCGLH